MQADLKGIVYSWVNRYLVRPSVAAAAIEQLVFRSLSLSLRGPGCKTAGIQKDIILDPGRLTPRL